MEQLREGFVIEASVVAAISGVGAVVATYLTLVTAATLVAGAIGSLGHDPASLLRLTPRTWRSLMATALGASLAAGASLPAVATTEPDPLQLGWAPSPAATFSEPTSPEPTQGPSGPTSEPLPASAPERTEPIRTEPSPAIPAADAALGLASEDGGSSDRTYIVERGDSLWTITERLLGGDPSVEDIARAWPSLYEANRGVIGGNPSLIFSGQVLHIPGSLS
jgi:hypothetical protein